MKTICLSSSMRFKPLLAETISRAEVLGIEALFPNLDYGVAKEELIGEMMQKLCRDEFDAIDRSDALYVLNPGGYIGTLVKIEIGYALGRRKPVFFSEAANSPDLDALCTGVIPVEDIVRFVEM
jgi:nucleoside 2-deoxyribosyltransferase